jgi:hypothetical protein
MGLGGSNPMRQERRIPSEQDFARANVKMEESMRDLDKVRASIIERFSPLCRLHNVYVLPEGDLRFRVLFFLETGKDLREVERTHLNQTIVEFAYEEIERVGRGKSKEVAIAFEFDSDENVKAHFQGDYWFRLH